MTTPQKGRIFISYRRTDSAGYAGRIYDRLAPHFGEDAIFMDVDTIEAGLDFVTVLQNAVQSCDVLVALIGRQWLNILDETGKRRLDNPEDFVRVEIAAALSRDIRVIPVLVDGAPMPHSTELPDNLKSLARRNAVQVDHYSFNADARRLISQLELALKAVEDSRILKARTVHEEQERKVKEAREAEERKRIERREHEERARLAAKQQGKKEQEERLRKEAEERKRKDALRKTRQREAIEHIGNIFRSGSKLPVFIGGGIVILFIFSYIIKNTIAPSTPSQPTETSTTPSLPSATLTEIPPMPTSTPTDLPTEIPPTPTITSTDLPTEIPSTPTPTLAVGSTLVSEKDGMVIVYVPAGEFQMGSEDGDYDEKPVHTVSLNAFWIDQTEVTNAMYAKCVETGECDPHSSISSVKRDSYYGNPAYEDYPVINVSWNDAEAYCEWAGRRLPTEAEWEKAASWDEKKQTKFVYPWGNRIECSLANYWEGEGCVRDTTAVGRYKSGQSHYGAYDMTGNVSEWVSSLYQLYPYSATDGREDLSASGSRVLRGGSWSSSTYDVRSTSRFDVGPSYPRPWVGFRCSRSAASP